jgi:soluble lytic murein transglycosylase-like protein
MSRLILMVMIIVFSVFSYPYVESSLFPKADYTFENTVKEQKIYKVEEMIDRTSDVDKSMRYKIANAMVTYGDKYRVKYEHLVSIAKVESNMNPSAINKESGDYGLLQINWNANGKKYVKRPVDLLDVDKNVEVACKVIRRNLDAGFTLAHFHSFDPDLRETYRIKLASARKMF